MFPGERSADLDDPNVLPDERSMFLDERSMFPDERSIDQRLDPLPAPSDPHGARVVDLGGCFVLLDLESFLSGNGPSGRVSESFISEHDPFTWKHDPFIQANASFDRKRDPSILEHASFVRKHTSFVWNSDPLISNRDPFLRNDARRMETDPRTHQVRQIDGKSDRFFEGSRLYRVKGQRGAANRRVRAPRQVHANENPRCPTSRRPCSPRPPRRPPRSRRPRWRPRLRRARPRRRGSQRRARRARAADRAALDTLEVALGDDPADSRRRQKRHAAGCGREARTSSR